MHAPCAGGTAQKAVPFHESALMTTEHSHLTGNNDSPARGIHVLAKPVGPVCNLTCEYCFYLEKKALFGSGERFRISDDVLSAFVSGYITSQPTPAVEFVWQGGEPTLLGIDFFKRVVKLQKPFAGLKTLSNCLQTNGTLLTEKWCQFLKKHNFIVGISLDGPQVALLWKDSERHCGGPIGWLPQKGQGRSTAQALTGQPSTSRTRRIETCTEDFG